MHRYELAIVGAGPAGLAAALEAGSRSVHTLLLDESSRPGGQLVKQIHKFFGFAEHRAGERGIRIAQDMLSQLEGLQVDAWLDSPVYGLFPGWTIAVKRGAGHEKVQADRVLVATGASENAVSFQGWTLPGVIGAGAAQTMMNVNRVLPGTRVIMVGSGNVGLIVAYQLLQAGARVLAIVEAGPKVGGYAVHAATLRRAGVPLFCSHTVVRAEGDLRVERVTIARLGPDLTPIPGSAMVYNADTVCLAVGLTPLTELCRMAGCEFLYQGPMGGFVPVHNDNMETTCDGLYVAGDAAGVEEASTAMEEGRLAGIAIAESLGRITTRAEIRKAAIRSQLDELRGLRQASRSAADGVPSEAELTASPGYTALERCKEGPRAVIECVQEIPCNACEIACKQGAIRVDKPITNLPALDAGRCIGCGLCIPACPGQAIFVIDASPSDGTALVSLPWEYLPSPRKGDRVVAADRLGRAVCDATVERIVEAPTFDGTAVVTLRVPAGYAGVVRALAWDSAAVDRPVQGYSCGEEGGDIVICRCEEIPRQEVLDAVRDGAWDVLGVKKRTRAGMGLCQGRTCRKLVANEIERISGRLPVETVGESARAPVRTVSLSVLASGRSQ